MTTMQRKSAPWLLAMIVALVLANPCSAFGQASKGQWLIEEVHGKWEVRESARRTHVMTTFDVLTPDQRIRCLSLPCTLTYATPDGGSKAFPLPQPAQARLNQWLPVPAPTTSPAGPRAAGLQEIIAKLGSRGGRKKDSPVCSGELPLVAPGCSELIDPSDFKLQWNVRPAEAGKTFTLLIGSPDSSDRKRWNGIKADAGAYGTPALNEYLAGLELPDRQADATIRLMRTESLDSIRLVRLPSKAEDAEYRRKVAGLSGLPTLSRHLALLQVYLTNGMWSKAAEISQALLRDAPESTEIRKFAIVGFCRSDFADEVARLRMSLKEVGITGFCDSDGAP